MQSASRCVVRNLKHAPWLQPPFPAATEEDCAQGYELPTQRYVAFANRTNLWIQVNSERGPLIQLRGSVSGADLLSYLDQSGADPYMQGFQNTLGFGVAFDHLRGARPRAARQAPDREGSHAKCSLRPLAQRGF